MELSDKVMAVSRMENYITAHLDEDISLDFYSLLKKKSWMWQ